MTSKEAFRNYSDDQHAAHAEVKDLHSAAERGVIATDRYGGSLVQFDPVLEAKLRKKIDWAILPLIAILYLFCFIDRANLGNAKIVGLQKDLAMTGAYDYNQLASVFYISYIVFEIPSNLACKWMGPGWFLPFLVLGFGAMSLVFAYVQNLPQACAVRFLLGMFESGVMPGMAYYLSRWYRRSEFTFRVAVFIVMAPLAGAFGGLLASAITSMPSIGSLHSWRMIFFVEGIITIGISVVALVFLTDRPESARWLTQEEKDLAIARVKSERIAQTAVLDTFTHKKVWLGIWNPIVLATAWVFLLDNITVQGLAFFLPTIIAGIFPATKGYTIVQQQLLTVPPYIFGAFFTLLFPYLGWKQDKRQKFFIVAAPPVMVGFIIFLATNNSPARYVATFVIASTTFGLGPLTNAQSAIQTSSDTSRSVALAVNMLFGNVGGLIATWSYIDWDKPDYRIGNGLNLAASGLILISSILAYLWMHRDNKRRESRNVDAELSGLTDAQIEDLEWKHPAWRWKP
ncbi:putative Major facilitator superfamily domain-containing protein [Seiridium unicorne]|uniref:Major facilitator superfamily domain-containing protein n=1 Tax=Seiridium unicorne TaxID=138068 RepID=A0ABR2V5Z1_9PEZI